MATAGFGLVVVLSFVAVQAAVGVLIAVLFCTPLVFLLAWLRRGPPVRAYLGLDPPRTAQLLTWAGAGVLALVAADLLTWALGREIVPEVMKATYASAGFLPALWVAMVVGAPLFEEIFFRGFLLAGLQASPLGSWGAILVTAAVWSVVHVQYDPYQIGVIFTMGILLGLARVRTGSVIPCLVMHSLNNLIATAQVAWSLRGA